MKKGQRPLLKMKFTDALTGEVVFAHLTLEDWDTLHINMERNIGDYYRKEGPKRDLG